VSTASGMGGKGELRIWDAATGLVVLTHPLTHGYVSKLAYSPDGTSLAAAVGAVGDSGVINVVDAATGRERFSLVGHRNMIWKLAFSPDGRRLASLASFPMGAPEVKLWDMAGGREMLTLDAIGVDLVGSNILGSSGFGFSPDGQRLFYVASGARRDALVQVWDATPLPEDRNDPSARP
jgi:WD40 repeat protein